MSSGRWGPSGPVVMLLGFKRTMPTLYICVVVGDESKHVHVIVCCCLVLGSKEDHANIVVVCCWVPNRIMPTLYVDVVVVVEHKALRYCY
jgi:hypothetical protein